MSTEPTNAAPAHLPDCDGEWPCSCVTRVEGIVPTPAMERRLLFANERNLTTVPTRELYDGIYEMLASVHEGSGTADGESLDGCPGCWAQAALAELARRYIDRG